MSDSSPIIKFPKINFTKLSTALCDIETKDILECDDLDNAYSKLELRVIDCIGNCTDHIAPKDKKDQEWFNNELRKLRLKKQRFYNKRKRNQTRSNKAKFDKIDKEYGKLIISKKKQYNHNRLDKFKSNLKS